MGSAPKREREALAVYAETLSYDAVATALGVGRETARRYVRAAKESAGEAAQTPKNDLDDKILARIRERFTDAELRRILSGADHREYGHAVHDFSGGRVKIGVLSDLHIGSRYSDPEYMQEALKIFKKSRVDLIAIAGDIVEGLSNRPGHVYECTEIGYQAQLKAACAQLSRASAPIYMVDGNHDRWYIKTAGAKIVPEICDKIGATFIGHDSGDIHIGCVRVRLWHGEDGSSYSHSYRLQKIIESFTGGKKPHVLIAGHAHKSAYFFDRHVHAIGAGAMQKQSSWMQSKRLPSHTGFWTLDMTVNGSGVGTFRPEWFPFYV